MSYIFDFHDPSQPLPVDGCYCQACTAWRGADSRRGRAPWRTKFPLRREPSATIGEAETYRLLATIFKGGQHV